MYFYLLGYEKSIWKIKDDLAKPINYNPKKRPNRQEIKDSFTENGAIYVTKYSFFKKSFLYRLY